MKFVKGPTWSLHVDQKYVDVTSSVPTPDEQWVFVDVNGHEHSHRAGWSATMANVVDESHWCDGTEGLGSHDPHLAVDRSHWECLECRVVVKPGMDPSYTPKQMPGSWSATLTGWRETPLVTSSGRALGSGKVSIDLTGDELALITQSDEAHRDAVVQRILDRSDRVVSWSSS